VPSAFALDGRVTCRLVSASRSTATAAPVPAVSRWKRVGRWLANNLLLSAVVITATTVAVTIEVTRTLDPAPPDILAQFTPAQNSRAIFEGELHSVDDTKGGLQSTLYADLMRQRGPIDTLYAHRRWNAAQAGYAALSLEIATSCHGTHPTMTPIPGLCAQTGSPATGSPETSGPSPVNTWTEYADAGGTEGPEIPPNSTLQIACKVNGFAVEDGDTWWYRIASAPWSGRYYASADAFYNNGATSGSLRGTPFFNSRIPNCSSF
jgi:hypothetical protein